MTSRAGLRGGALSLLLSALPLLGQTQPYLPDLKEHGPAVASETALSFRDGSFIVAPIPFSNPMIGGGLALGAGYLFTLPDSKPSGIGIGKMKSANGSEGLALGGSVNFADGDWTLAAVAGEAVLYYDLAYESIDIPLKHEGFLAGVSIGRAVSDRLSFSLGLSYLETDIAFDSEFFNELPPVLQPQAELDLAKISLTGTYDTRDNTFFPTDGLRASLSIGHAVEVDSLFDRRLEIGHTEYTKGVFSLSSYHAVGAEGVVALRGVLCAASSKSPFFDTCGVGAASGLRGFPATDYINRASASAQVEYRGRINERFGYVAFAALGGGGRDLGSMSLSQGGYSYGAGLRIRLSKAYKLDYAVDYAVNDQSEGYLYITLGQKF
ncbi:BamA/TamA family outer membrane protein [Maritimibacter alkaliphilus]|uniref:BamA/TamA family outer membrane protein n=1 Tax=Maritimibacter alkaliphilus TaxID=404236 RepID=UPI001C94122B|nr:BamA/TamA family outer membrane protein [Maritimibacter alkaliphilus]MBY6089775.1 outer membrane protein assembly factor [Maritimibacter alkaliphilus]